MPVPQEHPKTIVFAWEAHTYVEPVIEHLPAPEPKMVTVTLKCQHCGKSFQKTYRQTDEQAKYCGKECKDAHRLNKNPTPATVARAATAKKSKIPCPTPTKKKFPTQYAAQKKALSASRKYGHPMRAYQCGCGMWHMTMHRAYNMKG